MSYGRSQGIQPHFSFRFTVGVKIGLLVFLLTITMLAWLSLRDSGTGFIRESWQVDIFIIAAVVGIAVLVLKMIIQQARSSVIRYTDFVDNLGSSKQAVLQVVQSNKELRELGAALNDVHRRLQKNEAQMESSLSNQNQFSRLVEDSPNIVLLMNAESEVQYLNARGRQVANAIGLAGEDISVILPLTPSTLVEKCIVNNETLVEQAGSYRDRRFQWTVMPLEGEQLLQAHGTVISRRRKVDYQSPNVGGEVRKSQLYSISRHPDYQRFRGSILVIDGDDMMQNLISRHFKKDGFRIFSARNGEEGLELAERYKPDLITLDIMMPGKNGWMVLSALKEIPELASIPVVIVSSVGNKQFVHAMGADDFVPKPVDWDALGEIVNKLTQDCRKSGALL